MGALKLGWSFRFGLRRLDHYASCIDQSLAIGCPGKGITLVKVAPSGKGNSWRGEFWHLRASGGVSPPILKRDLGNTAQQPLQDFIKDLFLKTHQGVYKIQWKIIRWHHSYKEIWSVTALNWETEWTMNNGQTVYKNRTFTHNLQQLAQENNPIPPVTSPESQPAIYKSD